METEGDTKLDKLFAAARAARPDTSRAEFGFETRLLARIRAPRETAGDWLAWIARLVPVFAAVVVGLGVWTFLAETTAPVDWHGSLVGNAEQQQLTDILTGE